ncbi:MAG: dehydrogluconokinase, partial [Solirubrobacteraceae bacterium]|nr:dehydrogluconokinase [Solirubrobacteraceae bacterium]
MFTAGLGLHAAAASAPAATPPMPDVLDLLTVGEPLVCLSSGGRLATAPTLAKSIGGAEANVAIGLARLGLRTAYVSRVGCDPFGDEVVRTLRGEGVDVSRVQRSSRRPTGLMVKELRSPSDVRVHYYRQGSAATELDGIGETPRARHVHATGITLALGAGPARAVRELVAAARAMGASVSFDPNIRLKLWSLDDAVAAVREILPAVDDLLLSDAEALAVAGAVELDEALRRLADTGIARVVVRRGADGAIGACAGARVEVAAEAAGPVVDCVGAGDAATAGYLFERLRGATFEQAIATGAWAAGHVVAHRGDYEGLPDRADYDAWRGLATA